MDSNTETKTAADSRSQPDPRRAGMSSQLAWAVAAICVLSLLLNFLAWTHGSPRELRWLSLATAVFTVVLALIHFRVKRDLEKQMADRARAEELLRHFVQTAPVPVAMLDQNMNYVLYSRRWLEDFRLGDRDLTGLNHYEVFPEIPDRWKEVHQRCLRGAIERSEEDAFHRKDGSVDWLRWEVQPWHESSGRIGGIVMFVEVITERKRAQKALMQSLRLEEAMGKLRDRIVSCRQLSDFAPMRGLWIETLAGLEIPVKSVSLQFPSSRPGYYRTGWMTEQHEQREDYPLSRYPWVKDAWETGKPVIAPYEQFESIKEMARARCILEIPLPGIGSLGVSSMEDMAFDEEAIRTIQVSAGLIYEGLQRVRDFEALRESEERLKKRTEQVIRHQGAVLELTKVDSARLEAALQSITEISARTLDVERASIWFFNADRSEIICEDSYERSRGIHEKGLRLQASRYPRYFQALEESRTIAAGDARTDPRTSEFLHGYLDSLGITSMMDVPVRLRGKVTGIVCHEHTGPRRNWTPEEEEFAGSVADSVSLALEGWERKRAEESLKKRSEQVIHHQGAVLELAKVDSACRETALQSITEISAKTLDVERVSIWFFNADRSEIICEDSYERSRGLHGKGPRLQASRYPRYFQALEERRTIAADDARTDPRTFEFHDGYLDSFGITSMMDVPVRLRGKVTGIVCHEHTGPRRNWTPEEEEFAGSVADTVSLAIEGWERKQAAAEIQRQKDFSEKLINSSIDGIFSFDLECRFTMWNRGMKEMTGFEREATLGKTAFEVFPLLKETGEDTFFHETLAGMTVVAKDRPYDSPVTGRKGFFEGYFSPLFNETGEVNGGLAILRDITERKRSEGALREINQTLQAVFRGSPLGIITIDRDLKVTKWNPAAERIFGWKEQEVLGKALPLIPEEKQKEFQALVKLVLRGEGFSGMELQRRRKDGSPIDISLSTAPLRDAAGEISGVVGIFEDVRERNKAQEALRESEERFRKVFEEGPFGVAISRLDHTLLRVNGTLCQLLGYTEEELVRLNLAGVTHPEDMDKDARDIFRLIQGEISRCKIDKRFIRKDKEILWMTVTSSVLHDERGQPLYGLAMMEDITDRKRAEEALRATHQMLHTLIKASPLAIIAIDTDEKVTIWNPAAEQIFGWDEHEIIGKPLPTIPEDRRDEASSLRESALWGNTFTGVPVKRLRKDGSLVDISLSLAPQRDAKDEIMGTVSILGDITEHKRIEKELLESEERYRRFFEEDLSGAFIATREGRLLACNPSFARMFGFKSCEEAMKYNVMGLYPDRQAREAFLDLLQEQKKLEFHEMELQRRDGKQLHVIENVTGTFNEKGELIETKGYLFDITARKMLEEQLRQAQKMEAVGRLAGGVAHDFNNLLTAILGYSELLLSRLDELDPIRNEIEEIKKAGERAASLTSQLLVFSRRQVIQTRVLDLNAVIGGTEGMVRRLVGAGIDLVLVPGPHLGHVKADMGQLEQVLMNLVVNTRDAMPKGGRLTIETMNVDLDEAYAARHMSVKPGPYVMLAVSDTGIGMDAETQSHLFEPFFTTKEQGTGLGLSTVYGIVKQSGGNIWIYSELGRGTTVKIYLPRVKDGLEPSALAESGRGVTPQGVETILLVEDEEVVRILTREILKQNGYTLLEARHGGEALLLCERYKGAIHLMVTDVVMPQMTGRELADRLSSLRPGMKVLYVSGYPDAAVVHQGVLDPSMAFLQKPFTPGALARKVREVLDGPASS